MWSIIKDTTKFNFYGFSILALTFFASMLTNTVYYHPLWGTPESIMHYAIGITLVSLGLSVVNHLGGRSVHYRSTISA